MAAVLPNPHLLLKQQCLFCLLPTLGASVILLLFENKQKLIGNGFQFYLTTNVLKGQYSKWKFYCKIMITLMNVCHFIHFRHLMVCWLIYIMIQIVVVIYPHHSPLSLSSQFMLHVYVSIYNTYKRQKSICVSNSAGVINKPHSKQQYIQ